ncbi:MAG: hypothetical protein DDT40_00252 [candidate division WS2 bacterium]|uniref:DUF2784 domain-containing protein n=1 Tax=Psychracetigena formicireducens TaxID=2986056 RepID=A0A9E2BG90_PSYF1|nr:hypothetical protein [Candidatus Psychracetigena formicireducens]MBT9145040.1 hypothetical protein [Candidatus Psychracetigena formicireducens]MBT9150086.1 hypothetical protein [Candidatus Psychracetigena formicireducens]
MKGKWFYRISYRLVALFHLTLVTFLTTGAVLQFYFAGVKSIYLPLLVATLLPSLTKKYCPLSALEGWLRRKCDPNTTYKYFWDYYLKKSIRIPQPVMITVFLVLFSLALLGRMK